MQRNLTCWVVKFRNAWMHVIQLEWLPGVVWPTAMGSNSRTCCLTCSRAHNGYIVYSRRDWTFVMSPVRNKVAQWIMPKFILARTGLGRWCLCDGQLGQIWPVKTSKILAWVKNSTSRWKKKKKFESNSLIARRDMNFELWPAVTFTVRLAFSRTFGAARLTTENSSRSVERQPREAAAGSRRTANGARLQAGRHRRHEIDPEFRGAGNDGLTRDALGVNRSLSSPILVASITRHESCHVRFVSRLFSTDLDSETLHSRVSFLVALRRLLGTLQV